MTTLPIALRFTQALAVRQAFDRDVGQLQAAQVQLHARFGFLAEALRDAQLLASGRLREALRSALDAYRRVALSLQQVSRQKDIEFEGLTRLHEPLAWKLVESLFAVQRGSCSTDPSTGQRYVVAALELTTVGEHPALVFSGPLIEADGSPGLTIHHQRIELQRTSKGRP